MENSNEYGVFFVKRMSELNKLLNEAEADASKKLIATAIVYTDKSMKLLTTVNKNATEYVNYLSNEADSSMKETKNLLEQFQMAQANLLNSGMPSDLVTTISDPILSQLVSSVELTVKKFNLSIEMLNLTTTLLKNVLLDEIFKPKEDEFNYNKIFQLLEYIASKLIPGLDELKIFRDLTKPAISIKKDFLNQGDKLFTYLEEYIDAVQKWFYLSEKLAFFYNMPGNERLQS
ncbi:hypothetical protein HRH25_21780 [Flavisolibacter sp. BT320]|nr:hypothetical protein [Flavisolibacter longurius]